MDPLKLIRGAHSASLLGLGEAPYIDLSGDDKPPYDLNAPGVLGEIKAVLRALGQKLTEGQSPREQRWMSIRDDDSGIPTWDEASADSFALMLGRIASVQWLSATGIEEPWSVETPVGPSPTATGLEMLAGASLYYLGSPGMPAYLAWRGGTLGPPSRVSGPSATDRVVPPSYFGPFLYVPAGLPEPFATSLFAVEEALRADWRDAAAASDETARIMIAGNMLIHRLARDAIIGESVGHIPPREGQTEIAHVDEDACGRAGGSWDGAAGSCVVKSKYGWLWLAAIPVGVAGVYALTRKGRRW
jgi:hypothetical protein